MMCEIVRDSSSDAIREQKKAPFDSRSLGKPMLPAGTVTVCSSLGTERRLHTFVLQPPPPSVFIYYSIQLLASNPRGFPDNSYTQSHTDHSNTNKLTFERAYIVRDKLDE